jgi:sigma intracellular receptor 2
MSLKRSPLTSRPLDAFYFGFFILHAAIALLIDLQHLYPQHLLPDALKRVPQFYIDVSHDPLIMGAQGLFGDPWQYAWFNALTICLEG